MLETKKLLRSSRPRGSSELTEFKLPKEPPESAPPEEHKEFKRIKEERCPEVKDPEPYRFSKIEGQRYKFDYCLAFDLSLSAGAAAKAVRKPKGERLTLYNIIKYKVPTLVEGIKRGSPFKKVAYDPAYHQLVDTPNGMREYAVFSAYLEGSG